MHRLHHTHRRLPEFPEPPSGRGRKPRSPSSARSGAPRVVFLLVLVGLLLLPTGGTPLPPTSAATGAIQWLPTEASAVAAERSRPRWQWPLSPTPDVVEPFRPPAKKWLSGHRGVDLATSDGQEVRSPAAGTVSFSGTVVDRGVITVTTPEGRRISFEPVTEQLPRGTRVAAGQRIAVRGPDAVHEGCGGCLHWGVREGEEYVNPLLFVLDLDPSVLLPVPPEVRRRADSGGDRA